MLNVKKWTIRLSKLPLKWATIQVNHLSEPLKWTTQANHSADPDTHPPPARLHLQPNKSVELLNRFYWFFSRRWPNSTIFFRNLMIRFHEKSTFPKPTAVTLRFLAVLSSPRFYFTRTTLLIKLSRTKFFYNEPLSLLSPLLIIFIIF